jgi:glycosyltransferase involved in cell wall biosynthesis
MKKTWDLNIIAFFTIIKGMNEKIKKSPRVFVLIPALNEEKSISLVIDDIPGNIVTGIVVIDNGSTDNTAETAKAHGAVVLSETKKGYGHALMKGIHYITSLNPDIVVFLDGDYSDYPDEIPLVIQSIIEEDFFCSFCLYPVESNHSSLVPGLVGGSVMYILHGYCTPLVRPYNF